MFQHVSDPKHQSTDVFTQSVLKTKDFELKMRNRKWAYACLSHFTPAQMSLILFSQWMASRQSLLHRNKHKDEVSGSASNDLHIDVFSFKEFLKPHEGGMARSAAVAIELWHGHLGTCDKNWSSAANGQSSLSMTLFLSYLSDRFGIACLPCFSRWWWIKTEKSNQWWPKHDYTVFTV